MSQGIVYVSYIYLTLYAAGLFSLDLQEELQGGSSLRIADSDTENLETGDSIRSVSPVDLMMYRTSSPIPTDIPAKKSRGDISSVYSEDGGSSAWSQDQGPYRSSQTQEGSVRSSQDHGSYRSNQDQGSYRSCQDGEGEEDHALSFQSAHEESYGVKFPLDPSQ